MLLCANTDSLETELEINLIKSKIDSGIFEKIYIEFNKDDEDERFEKIDDNMQQHDYSNIDLSKFRKEMHEIFFTDKKFGMMEQNLDKIMDNILYYRI